MTTIAATQPTASSSRARGFNRYLSMAKGEMRILLRNKVATFYAVAFAPLLVLTFTMLPQVEMIVDALGGSFATLTIATITIFALSVAVYYNLTTAVVARREKLVLKRLVAGESTQLEILAAVATPNMIIALLQIVLVGVAVSAIAGAPAFTNPVLIVLSLALGIPAFVLISYITGAFTRTVEAAQLTTMPVMMTGMLFSGAVIPVSILPEQLVTFLELTPIYPIVQLMTLGLAGADGVAAPVDFAGTWALAWQPAVVMIVWNVILFYYWRRVMAWEPRR